MAHDPPTRVQPLPPEIEARLARDQADGVTFTYAGNRPGGRLAGIQWRPGDRNALAAAIHDRAGFEPLRLRIADREYEIRRVT
jgi:hypothetical protein